MTTKHTKYHLSDVGLPVVEVGRVTARGSRISSPVPSAGPTGGRSVLGSLSEAPPEQEDTEEERDDRHSEEFDIATTASTETRDVSEQEERSDRDTQPEE